MPEQYTAMKQKFMKQGMSKDEAQKKAAKIYNEQNPNNPVKPGEYEKKKGDSKSKGKEGSKSKGKGKRKESTKEKVRKGMKKAFPKE